VKGIKEKLTNKEEMEKYLNKLRLRHHCLLIASKKAQINPTDLDFLIRIEDGRYFLEEP
jgi:hypothetical protein